jgi:glycosyltransferase involved in cell wall biosynthesis
MSKKGTRPQRTKKHLPINKPAQCRSISVCLIVRDEERFLDNCLQSVKDIAHEIIIIDTGSQDNTVNIAKKYTEKIYFHPWTDSFSEARNHYFEHATGDWIFQIDADEELLKEDIPVLLKAVQNSDIDAIMVQLISIYKQGENETRHNIERIFRNNGIIHYEGRIHERLEGFKKPKIYPIHFKHYGYDLNDEAISEKKQQRNISLLKMDIEDYPDNPLPYHYLSCCYLPRGLFQETIDVSLKAIGLAKKSNNENPIFLWSRYNAAMAYYKLKDLKNAESMALAAITLDSRHLDSAFILTLISFDQSRWSDVIKYGDKYIKLSNKFKKSPEDFGVIVANSLNESWNISVLMGIAFHETGEFNKSKESFQSAITGAFNSFRALRATGIYCYNKGMLSESQGYLEKALAIDKEDPTVKNLLNSIEIESRDHQKISCCMIVKNEEAFLDQCLKSVKDYVDEIIIVDTGSSDSTVEIAERFTDRIYFHPWEGSFSKARNQALSYATCGWILQIDGDEELIQGSGEKLRETVRNAGDADAFHVNIISPYSNGAKTARHNFERLFRNNSVIHYEGIVHNRVTGQTKVKDSKIEMIHYGYNVDEKKAQEKFIRTSDLLKKQIEEDFNDPMPHHYLGVSYLSRGMNEDAAKESTIAIQLAEQQKNDHPLYLWARHNAAIAFFRMGALDKAELHSQEAIQKYPEHLDSHYTLTMLAGEKKQWKDVLSHGSEFIRLLDLFEKNPERAGLVINATMSEGPSVHLLIGHAWNALGNSTEMEKEYKLAASIAEDTWQVWWNAGSFHLDRTGNLDLAKKYLAMAIEEAPERQEVLYSSAKLNKELGLFQEERKCLEKLFDLGNRGTMVLNRLALLIIESREDDNALKVLDELLLIDPKNYTALCSIGKVYQNIDLPEKAMEAYTKALNITFQGVDPLMGLVEISLQLDRIEESRTFLEKVLSLQPGNIKALLYLCEIDLKQNNIMGFIGRCDLILKELGLNRNRTVNDFEDIALILLEIDFTLKNQVDLSAQVRKMLSQLPFDFQHFMNSRLEDAMKNQTDEKIEYFVRTLNQN